MLMVTGGVLSPVDADEQDPSPATATANTPQRPEDQGPPDPVSDTPASPSNATDTDEGMVSVEQLQQRLEAIKTDAAVSDELRDQLTDQYERAIRLRGNADAYLVQQADLRQRTDSAPARLVEVQDQLAEAPAAAVEVPAEASLDVLQQSLQAARSEVEQAKASRSAIEAVIHERAARRTEIPRLLVAARGQLDALKSMSRATDPEEPPALTEARRVRRAAERLATKRQIDMLNTEAASYEARSELKLAQLDLAARRISEAGDLSERLSDAVAAASAIALQQEQDQAQQAIEDAASRHPMLVAVAEANRALIEERAELAGHRQAVEADHKTVTDTSGDLAARFNEVQKWAGTTGDLSESFGLLLRKIRLTLPDRAQIAAGSRERRNTIERIQARVLDLEARRNELADIDEQVRRRMDGMDPAPESEALAEQYGRSVSDLLKTQRELVSKLKEEYNGQFTILLETDTARLALSATVDEMEDYINERILWIRSSHPITDISMDDVAGASSWLFESGHWAALVASVRRSIAGRPMPAASMAIVLLLALMVAFRGLQMLPVLAERVKSDNDRFLHTFRALAITIWLIAVSAIVPAALGWIVRADATDPFVLSFGRGLYRIASVLVVIVAARSLAMPNGLGVAHLRWRDAQVQPLRRHMIWLALILIPGSMLIRLLEDAPRAEWDNALGRIAFLVCVVSVAVASAVILRPSTGLISAMLQSRSDSSRHRVRALWHALAIAAPLALGVIAAAGYYYSALQLADRFIMSVWLFIGLILLNGLIRRWLYIRRRAIALEQWQRRRADAESEAAAVDAAPASQVSTVSDAVPVDTKEQEVDLHEVNQQTLTLLATTMLLITVVGIWTIWRPVLPALGLFDRIILWGEGPDSIVVTLADVLRSIVAAGLMVVFARNLPGLLEMTILQPLSIDAAARFAITTLVRYVVVILGIGLAFGAVGIGWSKVQWLAAAVTVGLGFGLQEIFANFVSGLIILFEQPVRIGDVVTVGDVTGRITRIRTRATTVTSWDRKEYIIPNREFITGRTLNWTHSDQVTRVEFEVGVAYGSDTERVLSVLHRVCDEHPIVLTDPAPLITFNQFGDSALVFTVRPFLPDLENRLRVIHELHMSIDKAFRQEGIEIAFPQRDLHIRSVPRGWESEPAPPDRTTPPTP